MKIPTYDFQWFEKEDHRKRYRASVSRDGKLRLGKTLCQELPRAIRVGFDTKRKVLAIADGHKEGIDLPKCGVLSAKMLSSQLTDSGLHLPVTFLLSRDEGTGFFLGRILPSRHKIAGSGQKEYDVDQLRILYQHIIDLAVGSLAKSTPLAERRACAEEAFYAAVRDYCPGCGDLEAYLETYIHNRLITENKQYFSSYAQKSLDQPLANDADNGFCLYDTVEASISGGIDCLEERIMEEQFLESLSIKEQKLFRMLRDGCSASHISQSLNLTEDQLVAMGQKIGWKRRQFYDVA